MKHSRSNYIVDQPAANPVGGDIVCAIAVYMDYKWHDIVWVTTKIGSESIMAELQRVYDNTCDIKDAIIRLAVMGHHPCEWRCGEQGRHFVEQCGVCLV